MKLEKQQEIKLEAKKIKRNNKHEIRDKEN